MLVANAASDTRRIEKPLGSATHLGLASLVNISNLRAVFFVRDLAAVDLAASDPRFETHLMFPERANVFLQEICARDQIVLPVWERAVRATGACGSAACAALVSAARLDLTWRRARIDLLGAELVIAWRENDDHLLVTGPVEFERASMLGKRIFNALPAA